MFNVLCNRNPWVKALVQTVVLTTTAGDLRGRVPCPDGVVSDMASTPEKDAPVTAACDYCGETIYRTGSTWPHANGLLFCSPIGAHR